MTASAKIWPSWFPCRRANEIRARFAELSYDLEREQDDQRAAAQEHAGGADREQDRRDDQVPGDVRGPRTRQFLLVFGPRARPEHDATDGGDQQHDRGDLEREQVVGQEQAADLLRAPEDESMSAWCERRRPSFRPITTITSTNSARGRATAPSDLPARPPAQRASARSPR
jgi:hypothetical protein